MAEFPSLPLFTDAYLADTGHLSEAEHGRYLLLLMTMWRCPECRIPNDKQWLSRRFRKPIEIIEQEWMPIVEEFMQSNGNWITQKRLRKEWEWCRKKRKQNSDAAKFKWSNEKDACERMSTETTSGNAPNSTLPIPTLEDRSSLRSDSGGRKKATRPRYNEKFQEFWEAYPRRDGANPKHPAETKFTAALKSGTDADAIIAGARRYADECRTRGQVGTAYVAQAVTWLNQRRWGDSETTGPPDKPKTYGWKPGMPTDEELRRKYANGREADTRERMASMVPSGLGPRPEDQ